MRCEQRQDDLWVGPCERQECGMDVRDQLNGQYGRGTMGVGKELAREARAQRKHEMELGMCAAAPDAEGVVAVYHDQMDPLFTGPLLR